MANDSGELNEDGGRASQIQIQITRGAGDRTERSHASDRVFRDLASAILQRELKAGASLPPERELSERFGVSRIVVREAVHRLKEYELVRVRQGSPTIVLDPDEATDIRLLGLEIDLMPATAASVAVLAERQRYAGAALLDLAEQRMTAGEIDELEAVVTAMSKSDGSEDQTMILERAYWTAIARGTRNGIYLRETIWWFNLMQREPRFRSALAGTALERAVMYRALIPAQRRRNGSADLYLKTLRVHLGGVRAVSAG
jgi:DNA-binding FadR family transcriptional regulator